MELTQLLHSGTFYFHGAILLITFFAGRTTGLLSLFLWGDVLMLQFFKSRLSGKASTKYVGYTNLNKGSKS